MPVPASIFLPLARRQLGTHVRPRKEKGRMKLRYEEGEILHKETGRRCVRSVLVHLPPTPRSTLQLIRRPGRKGMGRGRGSKDDVGIYFLCRKWQLMPPRCNFCLTSSSKQRIRKKDGLPLQKCGVEGRDRRGPKARGVNYPPRASSFPPVSPFGRGRQRLRSFQEEGKGMITTRNKRLFPPPSFFQEKGKKGKKARRTMGSWDVPLSLKKDMGGGELAGTGRNT